MNVVFFDFKFVEMPSKVLLNMIEKTIYATAGEEARFSLNGIYTEKTEQGNGLRMVATDGHRLAMVERELTADLARMTDAQIASVLHFEPAQNLLVSQPPFYGLPDIVSTQGESRLHNLGNCPAAGSILELR
jgi:hypothetical protein